MNHCMLDFETLSLRSNACILSIGAVAFNMDGVKSKFHTYVDPVTCQKLGMHVDANTALWWMGQSEEARKSIMAEDQVRRPIGDVFIAFANWCRENEIKYVWGNGAAFDNVIAETYFNAVGIKKPWSYSADRCYRTVKNMRPMVELTRLGTLHNAVDDAHTQAEHLLAILRDSGQELEQ